MMKNSKKIEVLKARKEEAESLHNTMISYFDDNKEMLKDIGMYNRFLTDCSSSMEIADKLQVEVERLEGKRK